MLYLFKDRSYVEKVSKFTVYKRAGCYCGKRNSHNRCLCPEKFSTQHAESFVVAGQDPTVVLINLGVMDSPVPLNSNSSQRSQIVVLVLLQV